jgi:hypothetical protein
MARGACLAVRLKLSRAGPSFASYETCNDHVRDRRPCRLCRPGPDYAGAAARLDQAREEIAPPLGATTYTLDSRGLLDQPGDENRSLPQSLRQLPGVTLGPSGELRVRGQ